MKILGWILRLFAGFVALSLAIVLAVLSFVVLTEPGAQLALREVESRTDLIRTSGIYGSLWGPLSVENLRYEDDSIAVEVSQLTLDWSLLQLIGSRVGISKLHAAAVQVTLKPTPPEPEPEPTPVLTALPVGVVVRDLRVAKFDLLGAGEPMHLERLALDASWIGDVVTVGHLSGLPPWIGDVALDGRVRLQADAVQIDALKLKGLANAELSGRYAYRDASDLKLQWTDLQWPPPPAADGVIAQSARGSLNWTGRINDWGIEAGADAEFDGKVYQIELSGRGSTEGLRIEQAELETGHGRIELQAQLDWAQDFTTKLQAQLHQLTPEYWLPQVSGELNGGVDADLRMDGGKPDVVLRLALDNSVLQGRQATLKGEARYRDDQLDLRQLELLSGETRLLASGGAWPRIGLRATLASRDLGALLPELFGHADAHVEVDGRWPGLRVRGNVQAGKLRYDDYTAKSVAADFDVATDGESRADVLLGEVDVGQLIDSAQLRLRGSMRSHELNATATTPEGSVALSANGSADADRKSWSGELTALRLAPRRLPIWSLEEAATLQISESRIEVAPVCIASDLARLCAALRPVDGGARRVALRIEQFRLAGLQPWLPAGTELTGQVDGYGYVDLGAAGIKDLRLDVATSEIELQRSGLVPFRLLPGYVRFEAQGKEMLAVAALPFEVDGKAAGGLTLDARLGPGADLMQRSLAGEWRVDVPDLSWLQLLNHELQNVRGHLSGELTLGGTLAVPDLSGSVSLADGGMLLRAAGIEMERISASLQGRAGSVLTLKAEATSDGGTLHLDGTIDTERGANAVRLNLYGDHFQAIRNPEASVWISPNLKVSFADRALRVDGSLEVPRADITPKTIDQGVSASADQVIVRHETEAEEAGPAIYANIKVLLIGEPGMHIDGLGLKSKLAGTIQIIEEPGVVTRARGELQLIDGRYKAYGQDLTITTGRLLFTGGPVTQPAVELRATRQPREDVTVGVLVRGTLDKPDFSLFSTPAMPQERQLSWLVLGRQLDQTTGSAERGRVADAAVSLGLAGGEWLAQRYGGKIGVDEISLGAKPGESTDLARLTLGKYLSPKLFISYGLGLFQPGHTFRMQYDLGGGFKLASEAGVESGGDLLYTIEK